MPFVRGGLIFYWSGVTWGKFYVVVFEDEDDEATGVACKEAIPPMSSFRVVSVVTCDLRPSCQGTRGFASLIKRSVFTPGSPGSRFASR